MWNVPVDHEMFKSINNAQWMWYMHNFAVDQEEDHIHMRDIVEYNASFIEPEAVKQIRHSRENAVVVTDSEFNAGLARTFGRSLGNVVAPNSDAKNVVVDTAKAIEEYKALKSQDFKVNRWSDYNQWFDIGLE